MFIIDPSRPPGSKRKARRIKEAEVLTVDYSHQSVMSVAAVAVDSLELLVKGLERSKNIKGDIESSLRKGLTELPSRNLRWGWTIPAMFRTQ